MIAMTTHPLTREDVLTVIAARDVNYPKDLAETPLRLGIDKLFDAIGYVDLDEQGQWDMDARFLSDTWADLRPSEQARLGELIVAAKARAFDRVKAAVLEEVVAAALAFAAEYPDAPRADQPAS